MSQRTIHRLTDVMTTTGGPTTYTSSVTFTVPLHSTGQAKFMVVGRRTDVAGTGFVVGYASFRNQSGTAAVGSTGAVVALNGDTGGQQWSLVASGATLQLQCIEPHDGLLACEWFLDMTFELT